MKKFVALYYTPKAAQQAMPEMTPQQKEAMMAPWGAWKQKYGDRVVDMGAPVMPPVGSKDGKAWGNSDKEVTGYSIVAAKDLTAAKEMFVGHPIFGYGPTTVELSEIVAM
ncbi:MAG: hypothetical protein LKM36_14760 [Flavobacteriales bacterium]|jgi:hypothetical protein|nr:hypothetical protein [Flavobacteriales bacterium]MCI1754066.1 hypothetical protein [Flavobacteriales bacterium]